MQYLLISQIYLNTDACSMPKGGKKNLRDRGWAGDLRYLRNLRGAVASSVLPAWGRRIIGVTCVGLLGRVNVKINTLLELIQYLLQNKESFIKVASNLN